MRTQIATVTGDVDAAVAQMTGALPLRRLPTLEDFANAAVFLASPAARSIAGHTLLVDGGGGNRDAAHRIAGAAAAAQRRQ